jgi:23S rRNA (adenine2030-N6)-methyltransferase
VLGRVIALLRRKEAAFRVIDTHAGSGLTDLGGPEASRSGEWRGGIGRLCAAKFNDEVRSLLSPYLDVVAKYNPGGILEVYPGSPLLTASLLRPQDRLIACDLLPEAAQKLAHFLAGNRCAKALLIDGWTALGAYVPPKERRGLVLIDPPFERADEFQHMAEHLARAHRKWPSGCYMLWYPIKNVGEAENFARKIVDSQISKVLRAEVTVAEPGEPGLMGSGLLLVNPPFRLDSELKELLPALVGVLACSQTARSRLDWLAGEK